jgi:hypothetical protein
MGIVQYLVRVPLGLENVRSVLLRLVKAQSLGRSHNELWPLSYDAAGPSIALDFCVNYCDWALRRG